jgi:CheY-like chemotaxis protein
MNAVQLTRRVLVVDDDEETRAILRTALRHRGIEADEAEDGRRALQLLAENNYAVVLLDLLMPDLDGFAVLEAIRATQATHPPVVLVVSGAPRGVIESIDARLIQGVVRKPFDPMEVSAIAAACVEIRGRSGFETMALATMITGVPLMTLLGS